MFAQKSTTKKNDSVAASASIIGAGNLITGNIESNGDIRIDGSIVGNVNSKAKVLVGPSGNVKGNINCLEADISGLVNGNIVTEGLLVLKGNAEVSGEIQTNKLLIEPTVSFNGHCHMGANIVSLKKELPKAVNE